jgi:Na+/proline symporter
MNTKRFIIAFVVVFVVLEVTNYIIYMGILHSAFTSDMYRNIFRPEEEMNRMVWISLLMDLVWSYFFAFFFVKGYENKGWMEGLRFGVYMGIFYMLVLSIQFYVMLPVEFGLVLQMFIYSFIQVLILGVVTSLIYKAKETPQAA